jgi:hypothetical protein
MDYIAAERVPPHVARPTRRDITPFIDAYCVACAISSGALPQTLQFLDRMSRKRRPHPDAAEGACEDAVWHDVMSVDRLLRIPVLSP